MSDKTLQDMRVEMDAIKLQTQNVHLLSANALTRRLGAQLDLNSLTVEMAAAVCEFSQVERSIILINDDDNGLLKFSASSDTVDGAQMRDKLVIATAAIERDSVLDAWSRGQGILITPEILAGNSPLRIAADLIGAPFFSLPLIVGDQLHAVLLADNPRSHDPIDDDTQDMLMALASTAAILVKNARQHSKTVAELAAKMHELHILRRVDRELMDTIELEPVFTLTLDWALRFSNAHAASLALYDQDSDHLYGFVDYGYEQTPEQILFLRTTYGAGIAQRVARSGRVEIVPDVKLDNDYIPLSSSVRSHLSLPVMREDRVVAVISIESKRLNGFTDDHVDFIEKLASRAGVAIDNARLYTETERERGKLSRILNNIADVVVVISTDDRLVLINPAALAALQLPPEKQYVGQMVTDVFANSDFLRIFQRAKPGGGGVEELKVADGRTFYVNLGLQEGIGWIIVMHDITPLKQTDQLKTELVQTVSHDLKQPLGVMNGYIELLLMQEKLDKVGENYARMILRSVSSMRQLIDDLLDLAKIESGVQLELVPTPLKSIIDESIEAVSLMAENKGTQVVNELKVDKVQVAGDAHRLAQIFTNLVGNAVKYSPPRSTVRVSADVSEKMVRIAVRDNGIGIAPEDQARIFDRFYRVRRQETKDIEGTGLGLAIVKRLVEAHGGQIGLDSRLGEGTTFFVSLPLGAAG
jgi:signal transduction histidine kinase